MAQAKEVPLGIIGGVVACALVGIHGKTLGNALTQIRGVSVVGYLVKVKSEFLGGVGVQRPFVRGGDGETLAQLDSVPIDLIVFLAACKCVDSCNNNNGYQYIEPPPLCDGASSLFFRGKRRLVCKFIFNS